MIFGVVTLAVFILFFTSLAFAWAEARVQARSEQRHGPNRLDEYGLLQLFADAYKVIRKESHTNSIEWFGLLTVIFPFVLVGYALSGLQGVNNDKFSLFTLLGLLLSGLALRVRAEMFTADTHRNLFGKNLLSLAVMGWLVFLTCSIAFIIHFDSASLVEIYSAQLGWQLIHFVKNPFLIISAALSFIAIFYLAGIFPLSPRLSQSSNQSRVFLMFWAQKFWVMALLIVWSVIFFGGWKLSILGLLFFLVRILIFSGLVLWLQLAFMRVVVDDAVGFALKWLMPTAVASIVLEIFALGILRI